MQAARSAPASDNVPTINIICHMNASCLNEKLEYILGANASHRGVSTHGGTSSTTTSPRSGNLHVVD